MADKHTVSSSGSEDSNDSEKPPEDTQTSDGPEDTQPSAGPDDGQTSPAPEGQTPAAPEGQTSTSTEVSQTSAAAEDSQTSAAKTELSLQEIIARNRERALQIRAAKRALPQEPSTLVHGGPKLDYF